MMSGIDTAICARVRESERLALPQCDAGLRYLTNFRAIRTAFSTAPLQLIAGDENHHGASRRIAEILPDATAKHVVLAGGFTGDCDVAIPLGLPTAGVKLSTTACSRKCGEDLLQCLELISRGR